MGKINSVVKSPIGFSPSDYEVMTNLLINQSDWRICSVLLWDSVSS